MSHRPSRTLLSRATGIRCSNQCELLLAIAGALAPEEMVAIAQGISNDSSRSAVSLAQRLREMPVTARERLLQRVLRDAGFSLETVQPSSCEMNAGRQMGEEFKVEEQWMA